CLTSCCLRTGARRRWGLFLVARLPSKTLRLARSSALREYWTSVPKRNWGSLPSHAPSSSVFRQVQRMVAQVRSDSFTRSFQVFPPSLMASRISSSRCSDPPLTDWSNYVASPSQFKYSLPEKINLASRLSRSVEGNSYGHPS